MKQFIIVVFIFGLHQNINSQNIPELFNAATSKIKEKDYKSAIEIYNKIIIKDVKNEKAYFLLGNCYDTLLNFPVAIENYSRVIALNGKSESALIGRALTKLKVFKLDDAFIDINKAILINPKNFISYNIRGTIKEKQFELTKTPELNEAMSDYSLALKLNPNATLAINNIAHIQYLLGDSKKAIIEYNKSISINSNQPDIYYKIGNIKEEIHDTIGALEAFNLAINFKPDWEGFYIERGKIYQHLLEYKKSYDDFNKAVQISNIPDGYYGRGLSSFYLNDFSQSIKDFTYLIDMSLKSKSENHFSSADDFLSSSFFYRGYSFHFSKQKNDACADWNNARKLGVLKTLELIEQYCK